MSLLILGISHKTASLALREEFSLSTERQVQTLRQLIGLEGVEECLVLSTCNRLEFYVYSFEESQALKSLENYLEQLNPQLKKSLYILREDRALHHGFKVASGLDSMVIGENQIVSQIKNALELAQREACVGAFLEKYFQHCFHASKTIRHETALGAHPVSVSYIAILLAKKIFGSLEKRKALLLGAGKMGELALQNLKSQGCSDLYICNRSWEKAKALAEKVAGHFLPHENFLEQLAQVDMLITSASSDKAILTAEQVEKVMKERGNKPLFLIDIALPRNIEEAVSRLYNVYLYNLDDLQKVVDQNLQERQREAAKAEILLEKELLEFTQEEKKRQLNPTIGKLTRKFHQIREQELERLFGQIVGLPEREREQIQACTQAIVNKILHEPLLFLKTQSEEQEPVSFYQELFKKLFRLDEE